MQRWYSLPSLQRSASKSRSRLGVSSQHFSASLARHAPPCFFGSVYTTPVSCSSQGESYEHSHPPNRDHRVRDGSASLPLLRGQREESIYGDALHELRSCIPWHAMYRNLRARGAYHPPHQLENGPLAARISPPPRGLLLHLFPYPLEDERFHALHCSLSLWMPLALCMQKFLYTR